MAEVNTAETTTVANTNTKLMTSRVGTSDDILSAYMTKIKSIPLLDEDEEHELVTRIKNGDESARRKLIESNLRLVIKVGHSFKVNDVPFMDIVQEGNLGLITACEKYDCEHNARFSTYATWWIRQTISRYLANKRRTIKLPNRKENSLKAIHRMYHELCQKYKRMPKAAEIAVAVGIPADEVEMILGMSGSIFSLDTSRSGEDRTSIIETQEDYTYSPVHDLLRSCSRQDTMRFLRRLKDRERRIILYRYQFIPNAPRTFQKIGEQMGISPEAVRQIELRALRKIRQDSDVLRDWVYA
jgi:RNA polymerase primary sigma factor